MIVRRPAATRVVHPQRIREAPYGHPLWIEAQLCDAIGATPEQAHITWEIHVATQPDQPPERHPWQPGLPLPDRTVAVYAHAVWRTP